MTALSYLASLNGRQQVTFPIGGPGQPAAVYPGTIASATWRMQVRNSATANGTLLLDSQVGGTWTYVGGAAPAVTFQWPTSAAALISPGPAAFDVLFIFPGADAELATAGSVAFTHGVTQAGVSGSPAAPVGADDTWTLVGAPVAPTSPTLASAVASANFNASAATSAQAAATASQTAAAASQTAAATSQTAAASFAAAAALSAGFGVATSVGGLAALNPSLQTAILTQNGRFGQFNWIGGNLATQVANDPGQGIYVAWSGDTAPGASGAWVRQYNFGVDWAWWGAVPDGVVTQDINWNSTTATGTDSYAALTNWQIWARYQSSLGVGVYVEPSPGIYCWTEHNVAPGNPGGLYWTSGISKLHINGRGQVTLQNLTTGGHPFPINYCAIQTGYLIAQTTQGASSFTCLTPADAANFTTGQIIMLGSLDTQYQGYPPNCQQFQYVKVAANGNTSTGVVTILQQIKDVHRADYPDYNYNTFSNGAARAWTISPGLGTQFDIDHTYQGLQINNPLGGGSPTYCTLSGKSIKTIDWIGCGFSETVAGYIKHVRPIMKTGGEPDKLVEYIEYDNPDFDTVGLSFQSANPRMLVINGGKLGGMVGCAQRLYMEGVDVIGSINVSCSYGYSFGAVYQSCRFNEVYGDSFGSVLDGAMLNAIDGTIVSYANGILSMNMVALGYNSVYWNTVPGMLVALQVEASDTSILFPGDTGVGVILSAAYNSVTGVMTINTSLPFATLPTWATGKIWLFKVGPVTMRDCTGLDVIRLASDAAANGQRYFEYWRQIFTGVYGLDFQSGMSGALVSVECNVINPGSVSSATLALEIRTFNPASNFAPDTPGYTIITFNLGVAGKRIVTTTAFSGKTGTDGITVAGSTSSYLPTPRVVGAIIGTLNTEPGSNAVAPLFELTIITDCGLARKIVTTELFGGYIGTNLPVQGLLQ